VVEPRADAEHAVGELDPDVEHLGGEVAVGEPPPAERPAAARIETDANASHVRLEPDRPLDRPGEAGRGPSADRDPEILVEDPAELDPGLEQQRLPSGDRRGVEAARGHGGPFGGEAGASTRNGPAR
jgi:hypothetical protein